MFRKSVYGIPCTDWKKYMKHILHFILTAAVLLSLAACDGGNHNITGIWEQEMQISILGSDSASSAMSVMRFTFRQDGTGLQEQIIADGIYPDAVREFTYTQLEDEITLNFEGKNKVIFHFVIDGNSLMLQNNRGTFQLTRK